MNIGNIISRFKQVMAPIPLEEEMGEELDLDMSVFGDEVEFEDEDIRYRRIPVSDLTRNLVYDFGVRDPEKVLSAVGMVPAGEDSQEMAQRLSTKRVRRLEPIIELVAVLSHTLTGAVGDFVKSSLLDDERFDDEQVKEVLDGRANEVFCSVVSVLSSLIDLDLISVRADGVTTQYETIPTDKD